MAPAEANEMQEAVQEALQERTYSPEELVARLRQARGFDEDTIREAIWRLLDGRQIRVTPDRKLAAPTRATAVAS